MSLFLFFSGVGLEIHTRGPGLPVKPIGPVGPRMASCTSRRKKLERGLKTNTHSDDDRNRFEKKNLVTEQFDNRNFEILEILS